MKRYNFKKLSLISIFMIILFSSYIYYYVISKDMSHLLVLLSYILIYVLFFNDHPRKRYIVKWTLIFSLYGFMYSLIYSFNTMILFVFTGIIASTLRVLSTHYMLNQNKSLVKQGLSLYLRLSFYLGYLLIGPYVLWNILFYIDIVHTGLLQALYFYVPGYIVLLGGFFIAYTLLALLSYYYANKHHKIIKDNYDQYILVGEGYGVLENRNLSIPWFFLGYHYQSTHFWESLLHGFSRDESIVENISHESTDYIDIDHRIYLYRFSSLQSSFYATYDKDDILSYLKEKEDEGYLVVIQELGHTPSKFGLELMKSPYLYICTPQRDIPVLDYQKLIIIKHIKHIYLELDTLIKDPDKESLFIKEDIYHLLKDIDIVNHFYHLMTIGEYCIVVRALYCLSQEVPNIKLKEPSLGIFRLIQNDLSYQSYSDGYLKYEYMHLLQAISKINKNEKTFTIEEPKGNIKYKDLTEILVMIRNRVFGHGVMTYSVSIDMTESLALIILEIVKHFISHEHTLVNTTIKIEDMDVPLYIEDNYLYNGLFEENNHLKAKYLNYSNGHVLIYDLKEKQLSTMTKSLSEDYYHEYA